jgi:endo-1,4-beta-xylanase
MGAAADRGFSLSGAEGEQFRGLLAREFSVLTPENDLKHARLRPERGVYRFERADSLVSFALAHGMKVRGHTLVWHRQIAPWLARGSWTADEVRTQLIEHVNTVARHYRGKLVAWDVVNEAIDDTALLRSSFWSNHLGREFIELAFRTAHAADPDVPLYYNDYNIEDINPKSDSTYAMMRDLIRRGVPVHGIGFQAHFRAGELPSRASMAANFARFAALGLKIQITELDIRITQPFTAAALQTQAADYRLIVDLCLQTPSCEMVVLWGMTDRYSWIPTSFPGTGAALLFDAEYAPKPAYAALQELLSKK